MFDTTRGAMESAFNTLEGVTIVPSRVRVKTAMDDKAGVDAVDNPV